MWGKVVNFISDSNKYNFDTISWNDNLILLYVGDYPKVFKWEGGVTFFDDSKVTGNSWFDYDANIRVEVVETEWDNHKDFKYDLEFVKEIIIQQMWILNDTTGIHPAQTDLL